jgi:phosphate transport system permease protein
MSNKNFQKRHRAEKRFKAYGLISLVVAASMLAVIIGSMAYKAIPAFNNYTLNLEIDMSNQSTNSTIEGINYRGLLRDSLFSLFPEIEDRSKKRKLSKLISSSSSYNLQDFIIENPSYINKKFYFNVLFTDASDLFYKGYVDTCLPASERRIDDDEVLWLEYLYSLGRVKNKISSNLFLNGDSREPEVAGFFGATIGSLITIFVTLILSFPVGVFTAIYLENFAVKNKLTDFIEVNINNLAAVPSIIFGLLGLAVFINFFGMPRSVPLVGGLVLSLMTLPTIIITTRSALQSVPPSIREAALAMGASEMQVVFQHLLPAALPGIFTGTIIGLARAFGESAPLLLIGMVAFIVDIPGSISDPATALPVQIYIWADSPERAFVAKTSAATLILIGLLVIINLVAVILRKRYEVKW